jgi:hypothetical protein
MRPICHFGLFSTFVLLFQSGCADDTAKNAEEQNRQFLEASQKSSEEEFKKRSHEINQQYVDAMKLTRDADELPTVAELDRMTDLGQKKNPTLSEIDEYNRIKAKKEKTGKSRHRSQ